ncbi:hypothetical protein QFC21_006191 [Naganishia friedmannii]|uniref:Uncharacterized protein n=1 Tax=Naganishia friedmannii TaxID=89922 RepID=A0ACC2V402_9TREE|nr:hypothetical protein QFC21_006191 [Naganishia friedmannii]
MNGIPFRSLRSSANLARRAASASKPTIRHSTTSTSTPPPTETHIELPDLSRFGKNKMPSKQIKAADFPLLQTCLTDNKEWAERVSHENPEFFANSAKGQSPFLLWIGCADSRVPESVVLGRKPGEIFVHRNIANQFHHNDDSANAVLLYAVGNLGVQHVAVVGHTACGGCLAAHGAPKPDENTTESSALSRFLDPLIKLRHSLPEDASIDDLIVANVRKTVKTVCESDVIQANWKKAKETGTQPVYVHGWLKDLSTGLIKDLECSEGPDF